MNGMWLHAITRSMFTAELQSGYSNEMVCCVWGGGGWQNEQFDYCFQTPTCVYVLVVILTWAYLVLGVMATCVVVVIPSLTVIKHLREAEHLGTHGFLSTKKHQNIYKPSWALSLSNISFYTKQILMWLKVTCMVFISTNKLVK